MLRITLTTLQTLTLTALLIACGQTPTASAPVPVVGGVTAEQPTAPVREQKPEPNKGKPTGQPGSLDARYGESGTVNLAGLGRAVAATPDGRVYLADFGSRPSGPLEGETTLRRLTSDGRLDRTFGQQGVLSLPAADVVHVFADGRILLARHGQPTTGGASFEFRRFLPTGEPDTTFGTSGVSSLTVGTRSSVLLLPTHVLAEPDGAVTFVVEDLLTRLTPSGRRDTAFGANGQVGVVFADAASVPAPVMTGDGPETSVSRVVRRPDGTYAVYGLYNPISGTPEATSTAVDFLTFYTARGAVLGSRGPTVTGRHVSALGLDVWADGSVVTSSAVFIGDLTLRRVPGDLGEAGAYTVKPGGFPADVKTLPEGALLTITTGLSDESDPSVTVSHLTRYDASGAVDASFGAAGTVTPKFAVSRVFVTDDGALLVVGDGVITRYFN